MKYLVLLLVIAVVVLLAKGARGRLMPKRDDGAAAGPAPAPGPEPTQELMLVCAHCGLHLPAGDALPGRGGMYCCEDHRAIAEARHGPG